MAETQDWFSQNAPAAPPLAIPRDGRGMPAVSSQVRDDEQPSDLLTLLRPLAQPETFTDFARLLTLPVDSVRKAIAGAVTLAATRNAATTAKTASGAAVSQAANGAAALGDVVDVDLIGLASPRLGKAVTLAQKVRAVREAAAAKAATTASRAPAAVAEVAPAAPAAAPVAAQAAPAAAANVVTSGLKLTAAEYKEFQRLLGRGMKTPDALKTVQTMRELAARLGGATPSEVAKAVAQRDTTGRW